MPWLAWLTVIAINLANLRRRRRAGLVGLAAGPGRVSAWRALDGADALVITSLFAFRTRDVARLAATSWSGTPGVTLGRRCLLVAAAGLTALSSEAALALAGSGSLLLCLLVATARC